MKKLLLCVLLLFPVSLYPSAKNTSGTIGGITVSTSVPDMTSNWTVTAWLYPTVSPGYNVWYSRYTNSSSGRQLFLSGLGATGVVRVEIPFVKQVLVGTTPLTANQWWHVAVTRSGNTWTVYVNGNSDGSVVDATAQESAGLVAIRAGSNLGPFTIFQGRVAESAGWTAVLSTGEISALAHGTPPNRIRASKLAFYLPLHGKVSGTHIWANLRGDALNGDDTPSACLSEPNHAPVGPPGGAN